MELLTVGVLGAIAVVAVTALAPRVGVAAPLLLVALGVALSLLPAVPAVEIEPEWILAGVLPPLLYSASVNMPTIDFRRDLTAISGLSVVLVVLTAVVLGALVSWLVPGVGLATGIAFGAVVSPTDAVATSIVRRSGVSPRIVTMLEGESLLNDASALVLLRSAIAATAGVAGSVSLGHVAGDFVYAVVVAVVIGAVVGTLGLRVRSVIRDPHLTTAVSFIVPFVAFLPAEHLGASGLVAAVAAGLVTGHGSVQRLRPQDRIAEEANWRTLELLLEGAVFLLMGLQLYGLVEDLWDEHGHLGGALGIGALAAAVVLLVRAGYVTVLLLGARRRARRGVAVKGYLESFGSGDAAVERVAHELAARGRGKGRGRRDETGPSTSRGPALERLRGRVARRVADIDYLLAEPLGPREGSVLVWAGMRGVVTLAAAQSLPTDTPQRSLLVLAAFVVAAGTLAVQGGTLGLLVRRLGLGRGSAEVEAEVARLGADLELAAADLLASPTLRRADGSAYDAVVLQKAEQVMRRRAHDLEHGGDATALTAQMQELRLAVLEAQRAELVRVRGLGTVSSAALSSALAVLDADQIAVEQRVGE